MTIAKRAYRHLQNHPYCLLFMLIFYLVYFILAFVVALLAKQFSDSSVQLSKIIASLDSQHTSLYEPFKVLESITTHYTMEYQHLLLFDFLSRESTRVTFYEAPPEPNSDDHRGSDVEAPHEPNSPFLFIGPKRG